MDEVLALELRLLDPVTRADRRQVEGLLHPDFREVGASGRIWSRNTVARTLAADPGVPVEVADVDVRQVAKGVVHLTYRAIPTGGAVSPSWRSSLWILVDAGWQLLFHQGTPTDAR